MVRVELAQGGRVVVYGRTDGLGVLSGENLIINGDFRINQRDAVSGATVSTGEYFLDRWFASAGDSGAGSTGTLNWVSMPGDGRRLSVGTSSIGRWFAQTIEKENFQPGTYVVSWKGDTKARIFAEGSPSGVFVSSPFTFESTATVDTTVEFEGKDEQTWNVKVTRCTVPTPFVPRLYGAELALCQRYYIRFRPPSGAAVWSLMNGSMYTSAMFFGVLALPVPMRVAPTLTYSGAADFDVFTGGSNLTASEVGLTRAGSFAQEVKFTVSGATQGHGAWVRVGNSGWLAFDAEL